MPIKPAITYKSFLLGTYSCTNFSFALLLGNQITVFFLIKVANIKPVSLGNTPPRIPKHANVIYEYSASPSWLDRRHSNSVKMRATQVLKSAGYAFSANDYCERTLTVFLNPLFSSFLFPSALCENRSLVSGRFVSTNDSISLDVGASSPYGTPPSRCWLDLFGR